MPEPIEVLLTEQDRRIIAKREDEIRAALQRRHDAFVIIAEMHGHDTGSLDYKDGKLYVTPPINEAPAKDSNHR